MLNDVTDDNDNVIIDCTVYNVIDCDAADDVIDCAAVDYDDSTDCAADDNDDVIDCADNDNDGDICYAAESDVGTAIIFYFLGGNYGQRQYLHGNSILFYTNGS